MRRTSTLLLAVSAKWAWTTGWWYVLNISCVSAPSCCQCLIRVCVWPSAPQELFPANKRSCEHFSKYFTDAGLKELSDFARNQQSIGARKELQKELQEQMSRGDPLKEVRPHCETSCGFRQQGASSFHFFLTCEHVISAQWLQVSCFLFANTSLTFPVSAALLFL